MPEITEPTELTEDAVREIEARAKKYRDLARRAATPADEGVIRWLAKTVDALIRDRKAMQGENERLRVGLRSYRRLLVGWQEHVKRIAAILHCDAIDETVEEAVAALRKQVAEAERAVAECRRCEHCAPLIAKKILQERP